LFYIWGVKTKLTLIFLLWAVAGWGQIIFQKTYGGIYPDWGEDVQQVADGGYIIVGTTQSYGIGDQEVYLIKTDSIGDTLWTKTYGRSNSDNGKSVRQTTDGGYILAGYTHGFGSDTTKDVYLIKTDSIGDTLWTKTYGGIYPDYGESVKQTSDGGYAILGYTKGFGTDTTQDIYFIKTNLNGDVLWTKTFGGIYPDWGKCIQETSDSGFIIIGYGYSFGPGVASAYLIKTDIDGNILWSKAFGGTSAESGLSVQITNDGGYIIAGTTNSFGAGANDIYLVKTDSGGLITWTKAFGGTHYDQPSVVQQTTDGGYIIGGWSQSFNASQVTDAYLIKTDANGNLIWSKIFGGVNYDNGHSVQQTSDGGYILCGSTRSFGIGWDDIYLIKTDANGNSGCNEGVPATITSSPISIDSNPATTALSPTTSVSSPVIVSSNGGTISSLCLIGISEIKNTQSITVYPNPATSTFTIFLSSQLQTANCQLSIYDVTGREVYQQQIKNHKSEVITHKFFPGIYVARLAGGGESGNVKFVVE
jgi:hypothetical protein